MPKLRVSPKAAKGDTLAIGRLGVPLLMKIISQSVNNTIKIGKVIARNLRKGDILCLFGELGSGKTVLTKGIACALGIKRRKVISPSFVLIRQYSTARIPLYHFDLYRLKAIEEILDLGYEEYFYDDGITVVEWAERLKYLLPKEYLKIKLSIKSDSQRLLQFSAYGRHYRELLGKIYESRTFGHIQKPIKNEFNKGAG